MEENPEERNTRENQQEEEKAFFGRGVQDLLSPPAGVTYKLGTYNPRALQLPSVMRLVRSFEGVGMNTQGNPIFIHVDAKHVEKGSYIEKNGDLTEWEGMEAIKFKKRADGKPLVVQVMSGAHRIEAMKITKERLEKLRNKKQASMETADGKLGDAGSENQRDSMDKLKEYVKSLTIKLNRIGRWCVLIYDGSECLRGRTTARWACADGGWVCDADVGSAKLWNYLSQNEHLPVLRATPEERVWNYKAQIEAVVASWDDDHKETKEALPKPGSDQWQAQVTPRYHRAVGQFL